MMSLYISISLLLFGVAALLYRYKQQNLKMHFLAKPEKVETINNAQALNIRSLHKLGWRQRIFHALAPGLSMLGDRALLKIALFMVSLFSIAVYVNNQYLGFNSLWLPVIATVLGCLWSWLWLVNKRRNEFEKTFPDALNIMMSAVTAGESIMQSISYVGRSMDNPVGQLFKKMGEHLKLGEPPEQVFNRAIEQYPYPAFIFFVVTIRANMARGGQLKSVLARLIRILVDSRTLEKKKESMTSEARMSAKIVAALPLIFMIIISYISPGNIEFVLHDPDGRYLLYYVIGSELFGLSIIAFLMRGVR